MSLIIESVTNHLMKVLWILDLCTQQGGKLQEGQEIWSVFMIMKLGYFTYFSLVNFCNTPLLLICDRGYKILFCEHHVHTSALNSKCGNILNNSQILEYFFIPTSSYVNRKCVFSAICPCNEPSGVGTQPFSR